MTRLSTSRIGFMSQISPDGRYVLTNYRGQTKDLSTGYFTVNFKDYRFLQVFYPTRSIVAWYNRATGRKQPLPGADDPRYVQTNAVWSPDGKYVVFVRAEASDPYPPGNKMPEHANDPEEPQIQYDLYRVPFNDGKGGQAVPIAGASHNGMSNSFPKISPDGRWIVWVQCRNARADASGQPALHRARHGRRGAADALQYFLDELLAQLLAQRPLAGLLLEEPLALHASCF